MATEDHAAGNVVSRALRWLRAGYPEGVPHHDYVALLGLLHRRLTPVEVEGVAREVQVVLGAEGADQVEPARVREFIARVAHEKPGDDDVERVLARLRAGGWPADEVPEDDHGPAGRDPAEAAPANVDGG